MPFLNFTKAKSAGLILIGGAAAGLWLVFFLSYLSVNLPGDLTPPSGNNQPTPKIEVPLATSLGQSLIIGLPGTTLDAKTRATIEHIKPAGVVFYQWNYLSDDQLKSLIAELQSVALQTSGLPLFIMTDAEPDGALRFGLFAKAFKNNRPDWEIIKQDTARLKALGFNVDLAPLADFIFNPRAELGRWQLKKFNSPTELANFNEQFIATLTKQGLLATLKHFPGGGLLAGNPHNDLPQGKVDPGQLQNSLELFRQGINHGADFIMTNHARYDELDPEYMATLSPTIINNWLINKLGFRGLIITDDLSEMKAVATGGDVKRVNQTYERYGQTWNGIHNEAAGLSRVALQSLRAGHHLLMFSHWLDNTRETFDLMLPAAAGEAGLKQRLQKNYEFIKNFKQQKLKLPAVSD